MSMEFPRLLLRLTEELAGEAGVVYSVAVAVVVAMVGWVYCTRSI